MLVSLKDLKQYLRVDATSEDVLIENFGKAAERLVRDVLREDVPASDVVRVAILYAASYLYEHREEADHHALLLTLRSILFGERRAVF